MKRALAAAPLTTLAAALAAWLITTTPSQAAVPVATAITPSASLTEYTGAAPVGVGAVDMNATLYFIDEKTVAGLKSWFVFFDAAAPANLQATLWFDAPIVAVYSVLADLQATTPTYGAAGVTYSTRPLTGLESGDQLQWAAGSHSLTLSWNVNDPGDHIRVLTAVPEPATATLYAAGLLALGFLVARRREPR